MDLNSFSSFLEVFTGLNFVYVLSQSFIETIKNNFSNAQNAINDQLEDIRTKLKLSKNNVFELGNVPVTIGGKDNTDTIKEFVNTLNELEIKLDDQDSKNKKNIETKINILELRSICLFAGLFCLFYLIIISLQEIFPLFIQENSLLSINVFSIIFVLISIFLFTMCGDWKLTKFFQKNTNIIISFLSIITVSFIINNIPCLSNKLVVLFSYNSIEKISQTLILFIPSLHFILYFVLVIKEKNKLCKQPMKELTDFELEFDNKNKIIDEYVKSIKLLQIHIE